MLCGARIVAYMTGVIFRVNVGQYSSTMEHLGLVNDVGESTYYKVNNLLK